MFNHFRVLRFDDWSARWHVTKIPMSLKPPCLKFGNVESKLENSRIQQVCAQRSFCFCSGLFASGTTRVQKGEILRFWSALSAAATRLRGILFGIGFPFPCLVVETFLLKLHSRKLQFANNCLHCHGLQFVGLVVSFAGVRRTCCGTVFR